MQPKASEQLNRLSLRGLTALFLAGILANLVLSSAGWAADAEPTKQTSREIYLAAEALRDTDPVAAYAAMRSLASRGDARGLARLAYYTLKGIGTAPDARAAEVLYTRAADAGHERSLLSRAKVLMILGDGEASARAFDLAVLNDVKGAAAERASAHAQARLGAASQPEIGWRDLHSLSGSGDEAADLALLNTAVRRRAPIREPAALLNRIKLRAERGEGRAAEALLRYLRGPGRTLPSALDQRRTLVRHEGLRPSIAVEERLHLASQLDPANFWTTAEQLVNAAPDEARARGLVVTAQISRNAYLWIAETRFLALGYEVRGKRGYLTSSRIRAIQGICAASATPEICSGGPIKMQTVKVVAAALFPEQT